MRFTVERTHPRVLLVRGGGSPRERLRIRAEEWIE